MGDPPEDPGGTNPPGSNIKIDHIPAVSSPMDMLITALESSMDTDCSNSDINKLKRKRNFSRVVCNMCHKRKRKSGDKKDRPSDCKCVIKSKEMLDNITDLNLHQPRVHSESGTSPLSQSHPSASHDSNIAATNNATRIPIGRTNYQSSDVTPYVVHVQKETISQNNGTTLHPVSFGRFLKTNNIQGIVNGSLKRIGRNRISMSFCSYQEANIFLQSPLLEPEKYKAFIPTSNITRMGIARGVPSDWSDEEILANITVPVGCGSILKIRRLKRKVTVNNIRQFENTGTIVITFDGQVLPNRVYMCYTALPVELYIYPTIQCYNCCRYGHVKTQCRSSPRCFKCGQGHSGDSCNVEEDDYWCCMCKGFHEAINKKCLEFTRQKSIKEAMSKNCISYMEAVKLHPPINKLSYTDALLSTPPSNNSNAQMNTLASSTHTQSYRKTVFQKPKLPQNLSKGYDHAAHYEIIKNPVLPMTNILDSKNNDCSDNNVKNAELIKTLIILLSQSNNIPSNVAIAINALNKSNNLNGSNNTVELSEPEQQKK